MSSPAKCHLVWVFPPNTSPWLGGKQTPASKNDNLVKGTRTYRNLGLIPSHCRRCTAPSFLLMAVLIQSSLSSSRCQHSLSPAAPTPEQSSCTVCAAEAIGRHVTNLMYHSSVKIWGNYQLETQNRSDCSERCPCTFTPASTSSSLPRRASHHTGVQSTIQWSNAKCFVTHKSQ